MEFASWELYWVTNSKENIKQFMELHEEAKIRHIDGLIKSLFKNIFDSDQRESIINQTSIFLKLLTNESIKLTSTSPYGISQSLIYNFWVGYLYQSIYTRENRSQVLDYGEKYLTKFVLAIKKEIKRDKQENKDILDIYTSFKHIIKHTKIETNRESERKMAIDLIKIQRSYEKFDSVILTTTFNNIDIKVLFLEAIKLLNLIKKEATVLSNVLKHDGVIATNKDPIKNKAAIKSVSNMKVWKVNNNKDVENVYLQNVNKRKMVNFDSEYYFKDRKQLKNIESFKSGKIFNAPQFTVEEAVDKEHEAALKAGVPHACCDYSKLKQNKDNRSFYYEDREDEENEENKRKVKMEWDELRDQAPKGRGT